MAYAGSEKRKHARINARFIVSYRIYEEQGSGIDISQTKNVSLGGMLLTTNKPFDPGVNLAVTIRVPFDPEPINIIAEVISSKEIVKNSIYDTRLNFINIDDKHKKAYLDTLEHFSKKKE